MRTGNAGRIVQAGIVEAAGFEILDAGFGVFIHFIFGAEGDGVRWAGLGASRSLADRDAVRTQRSLVSLVVDLADAWDVEWTSLYAITAADAVFVHKIDDTVGVLHDGTGRRASLEAARVLAMHA